jgi:hypothetical protein
VPEAISVAQTTVPSDSLYVITSDQAARVGSLWQSWSATPVLTAGPLAYDQTNDFTRRGCNDDGSNPYTPGSHAGQILIMDRGVCAVSLKVSNAAIAGANAATVANNVAQAPGELPPTFSFGGGNPSIPGYTITQADGNVLKATLGNGTIDPNGAVRIVNHMVTTSSRGPNFSYNTIKPDIGAPGASISAIAGTGFGEEAFGGTSGAAPMVTGSVALMLQKYPERPWYEIKSVLMNTAETDIFLNAVALPGVLAPITRIGGGEVRVDRAFHSTTAAWDDVDQTGSLSFGYHAMTAGTVSFTRTVSVRNYSDNARTYHVTSTFRNAAEEALGAVSLQFPTSVPVPAHRRRTFNVTVTVDPSRLRPWTLNGGSRGGDGYRLQEFNGEGPFEFDGYLHIADDVDNAHLAWQVFPHKSADVRSDTTHVVLQDGHGTATLSNPQGVVDGRVEVFSLLSGTEEFGPAYPLIRLRSIGVRQMGDNIQFAVNTIGERAHPNYPAEFDITIQGPPGGDSFLIFNLENGGFGATGQNVVGVENLRTMVTRIFFFTDADLNSANAILTAPLSAVNLTPDTQFNFSMEAVDNYFTGLLSHGFRDLTYTPAVPRYVGSGIPPTGVPAGGSSTLMVDAVPGGDVASPSQTGLLLMYRDAVPGREADPITVTP